MRFDGESFESTVEAPVVDKVKLRKLTWNGIPDKYRAQTWKILCGYVPADSSRRAATLKRKRKEYLDFAARCYGAPSPADKETLRQVRLDVPRTSPHVALYRHPRIRTSLERLLYTWAIRHPAASYVQGINDLATPLLAVFLSDRCFDGNVDLLLLDESREYLEQTHDSTKNSHSSPQPHRIKGSSCATPGTTSRMDALMSRVSKEDLLHVEADCFWCLTSLLSGIQDHYTPDQPGLQRMVNKLEKLIIRTDGELYQHLRNTGVEFIHFAYRWMNCLLLREMDVANAVRMWDTYFAEGITDAFDNFHVFVCAALLRRFSDDAKSRHEFDDLFFFLQNLPTCKWTHRDVELMLSEAFVIRSSVKDIQEGKEDDQESDEDFASCQSRRFSFGSTSASSLSSSSTYMTVQESMPQTVPQNSATFKMNMLSLREQMEQAVKEQIEQAVNYVKSADVRRHSAELAFKPKTGIDGADETAKPSSASQLVNANANEITPAMYDVDFLCV